jgi:putative DNA primase/helicase
MTAEKIAKALGGHRAGATWMARCPSHDDRAPSLSISDRPDGKVLVRCHAGCDQRDVVAALRDRGLWEATGRISDRHAHSRRNRVPDEPNSDARKRAEVALAIWLATQPIDGTLAETYVRSRGLDLAPLPALRFHSGLKHPSGGI